jgi:ubiquitin
MPDPDEALKTKIEQAKARLQALEARYATQARKNDTRRKIIAGGLLFDSRRQGRTLQRHPSPAADPHQPAQRQATLPRLERARTRQTRIR